MGEQFYDYYFAEARRLNETLDPEAMDTPRSDQNQLALF